MRRIDSLMGHAEPLRRLAAALARQRALLDAVAGALPAELAAHCVSASIEGAALRLLADSPAWATRLRYHGNDLRRALRSRWRIDSVTVQVEPLRPPTAERPPRRAALSAAAADAIVGAASAVEDAALRQALLRLSRHGRR
jgi:hypothetical protein